MRVSPVAYVGNTLDEVLAEAKRCAEVTHDHEQGIRGAQAVAAAIFLARTGATKVQIKRLVEERFDYFLDETVAYENFVNFNGYVPPQNGIDADSLVSEGVIPESLAPAVVRPEQFLANQELLQLTVEGERLYDQAWSRFRAG